MRDGLVPEQRANRDGVVQTKWVRPEAARTGKITHIPVPAAAVKRDGAEWPMQVSKEYTEFLRDRSYLSGESPVPELRDLRTALPELGRERAARVIAMMRSIQDLRGHRELARVLGPLITDGRRIHVDYRGPAVDNLLSCIPQDEGGGGKAFGRSVECGAEVFEAHPKGRTRTPFDADYAGACRTLAVMLRDGRVYSFQTVDAVAVLPVFAGNFDRFEPVMAELRRRGAYSPEIAAEILGVHGALGDGAL